MASEYPCDNDDGNQALFTVANQQNGDTLFVCPLCFGLMGAAMLKEAFPQTWAETIAPPEPEPTQARGKRAKATTDLGVDIGRTIAEVVDADQADPDAKAAHDDAVTAAIAANESTDAASARPDGDDPAPY